MPQLQKKLPNKAKNVYRKKHSKNSKFVFFGQNYWFQNYFDNIK